MFRIDHRKYQPTLWGTTCESDADVYLISSASEVIVFEDKSGKQATPHNNGFVGQIIGGLMMMKRHNESTKKGSSGKDVFAVRIINHHVPFFKLTCSAALHCCSHDATKELGIDLLINEDERCAAMEAFTAVRETVSAERGTSFERNAQRSKQKEPKLKKGRDGLASAAGVTSRWFSAVCAFG